MIIKCAKKIRALSLLPAGQGRSFCSGNDQMKFLRDRAYLASNIIKRIKSKNNIDELKNLSLTQSIIKYLETAKNVEDKARSQLLDHFKDGVQYDMQILDQERFQKAQINENKIKFFPTKFVASQLFIHLLNNKHQLLQKRTMYTGNFGISKSFSAALYARLSNMIAEYNFKNFPEKDYLEQKSGIINSPKVLYYNFIQADIQANKLRQKLLNQISPEINKEDQNNYLNYKSFREEKNQKYHCKLIKDPYQNRGIRMALFIDQISEYFSMMRKKKEKQILNSSEDPENLKMKIERFQAQLKQFDGQFNSIIYFSSMDIEQDLIAKSYLNSQNSRLTQITIPYAQRLYQNEYMSQIIDVFLFCFKEKFQIKRLQKRENSMSKNQISFALKIKEKLLKYLYPIRLSYFLSFLYINQEINDKFSDQKMSQPIEQSIYDKYNNFSQSELQNAIFKLFKQSIQRSKRNLKKKFDQFLSKRNLNEKFFKPLIIQLYFAAHIAMKTGTNFYKYEINLTKHNTDSQQLSQNLQRSIYKQIFSIKNDIARCIVPPEVVIEILSKQIGPALLFIIKYRIDLLFQQMNNSVLGGCAEVFFIHAITAGRKKLTLIDTNLGTQFYIQDIVSKQYRFEQINRPRKKISNTNEENIDQIKKKPNLISTKNTNQIQNIQSSISSVIQEQKQQERQFLSSFIDGISEQIKNIKQSKTNKPRGVVFLPRHKQYVKNQQIIDKILSAQKVSKITDYQKRILEQSKQILASGKYSFDRVVSHTSKAIDFVIVRICPLGDRNFLNIYAFDMTISKKQVTTKFEKFLSEFKHFYDRNKNKLAFGKQQYSVDLSYYVICPKRNRIQQNHFDKKFGDTFSFSKITQEKLDSTSRLKVVSKQNQKQCILKCIGTFDIFSEIQVMDMNSENDRSNQNVQIWKYFRKQLNQSMEERKEISKLMNKLFKVLDELLGTDKKLQQLEQDVNNQISNEQ